MFHFYYEFYTQNTGEQESELARDSRWNELVL